MFFVGTHVHFVGILRHRMLILPAHWHSEASTCSCATLQFVVRGESVDFHWLFCRVHSSLHTSCLLTSTNIATVFCESAFEGGNWALVRRVKQGTTWHTATDDLAGTAVYGTYGTATSDSTFSIAYSSWITPTTELLFISGKCRPCASEHLPHP